MLNKKSVELLAPVGQWNTLEAAVKAGADAVYLGGQIFNMRMFRADHNFDNNALKKAVSYCHDNDVKLYVTLNNLISESEVPELTSYLQLLADDIKPDALIVQDLAVLQLVKKLGLKLNLHASVMLNAHNETMIKKLQEYGVSRVVASREMHLSEISLLKERTGVEIEYFIHGDMCIAEGGTCTHSGVLFGNSGSRGRCMKACRWQYKFAPEDKAHDEKFMTQQPGSYKMALKDLCMYRALPQLIAAGAYSFKIEGRMRDAAFVGNLVSLYRRAIDRYIADPSGYHTDEKDWQAMEKGKVRGFTTSFALDNPDYDDVALSGEHEPKIFSKAIKEAALDEIKEQPIMPKIDKKPKLAVRCTALAHLKAACENGADIVYAGGDVYRPLTPWTLADFKEAKKITAKTCCQLIINTPRITRTRELNEYAQLFNRLEEINPAGILVHNLGMLALAKKLTKLPVYCGASFNICNDKSAALLQTEGAVQGTASIEMPLNEITALLQKSSLPVEILVHGAAEAMICDFDYIAAETGKNQLVEPEAFEKHYAFVDTAGEVHPLRRNQYDRTHILFANDLCLLPYLPKLMETASFCIEAQDYTPEYTGRLVNIYRQMIDDYNSYNLQEMLEELEQTGPRKIGAGVYR